jgi:D-alanyl-D-alanine carboxypeptidase/D-alanyl-D-alanine-endopeptidase (penicillin-binding protein 4)
VFRRSRTTLVALPTLFALVSALFAGQTSARPDTPAAAAVRGRLTTLLAALPQTTNVGLVVLDAADGAAWFAHDPHLPLKPASVMKLFVTAAALERFGPKFRYETRLYVRDDELLVIGSGDPGLGDERLAGLHDRPVHSEFDAWADQLRNRGVTTLSTIALDDRVFDRQHRHPDWPPDQAQAWYQAPVGGLNFNDNCLDARVTVAGGKVQLALQPKLPAGFFQNSLELSPKHAPVVERAFEQDVFEFSGPVARDDQLDPISARRPTVFFGYALLHALKERGVIMNGHVVRRAITSATLNGAELLAVHTTSLRDVLWRANTFSQNLFAECLLKSLAAYDPDGTRSGVAGSWEGGVGVLRTTLQQLGLTLDGAALRDGSGLSHEDRVTAEQVVQLLLIMRRHPHGKLFIETLAQPGEDGSMRRRYDSPVLRGRLRAKTGTISGVRTLAGYATRPDGTTLAFALLINGEAPNTLPTQVAEALVTPAAVGPQ